MVDASHTVVAPSDLDAANAASFATALSVPDDAARVVVDCSGVEFIDSSGVRALVVAHNRLSSGGGSLRLASATRVVRRVIELCGLDFLLAVDDDGPSADGVEAG